MALEFQGRQEQTESSDCKRDSSAEPHHQEGCLDLDGLNKITSDFPSASAYCHSRTMTSQQPLSEDGGSSMPVALTSDQAVGQEVQTLKALSLNGLNQNLCHSASASEDSHAIPSGAKSGRPHPMLSWGDVTEIPNGATGKTQEYVKHPIGSSSGNDPWQVRSTQNPSRPLVRRPTPMAIRVPKSVLGKASSKMMTQSFEEEEEEEHELADGEESPVPVSLKPGTNTDVLVIEDVESSDADSPSPRLSTPKDLPLGLVVEGHSVEPRRDTGSPTIVVQTDIGARLSPEEAENQAEEDEVDNDEEEEDEEDDDFDVDDKQFLSPTTAKSFEKNPHPPASNSQVKTVPPPPKKLVRRQTPITLDLPKNLKEMMPKSTSGILEEEEEEEEEENEVGDGNKQHQPEEVQATTNQMNEQKPSEDNTLPTITSGNDASSGTTSEKSKTDIVRTVGQDTSKNDLDCNQAKVPGRPDIIDSVNCNNNNHEASSLDLVEGASHAATQSQNREHLAENNQDMGSPATQRKSLFRKSQTSTGKDGSGSPSSARRKVSAHHTKILQRQPTPIEIKVPKHVISEAMKERSPDSVLEEDEDEI